jgi:Protein of unknown function (DUF3168)
MPPFEKGLYQMLRNDPGVSSYVNGRIWGNKAKKGATYPFIVFTTVITEDMGYHAQGAAGLRKARVQFDCYSDKYIDTVKTKDAIRVLLQSFAGQFPDGTSINGCIVVRDMDFPYEPGSSGYVHRRLMEIDIIYTETVLPFVAPNTIFPNLEDFDTVEDDGQA